MDKTELRDLILPKLVHEQHCHSLTAGWEEDCTCIAKDNTERILDLLTEGLEEPGSIAAEFSMYATERLLTDAVNALRGHGLVDHLEAELPAEVAEDVKSGAGN